MALFELKVVQIGHGVAISGTEFLKTGSMPAVLRPHRRIDGMLCQQLFDWPRSCG